MLLISKGKGCHLFFYGHEVQSIIEFFFSQVFWVMNKYNSNAFFYKIESIIIDMYVLSSTFRNNTIIILFSKMSIHKFDVLATYDMILFFLLYVAFGNSA